MRYPFPLLSCAALCAFAAGCGSSGSPTPTGTLTGNWNIALLPSNSSQTAPQLGGYITNTNNSVSGTLLMQGLACTSSTVSLPITGTLTPDGNISFTGTSSGGLTLTIIGTYAFELPRVPGISYPLNGTYSITDSCVSNQSGSMMGLAAIALEPGTYTGTFQSSSGNTFGVSMPLAQSGPDADGEYSVAPGMATITGSPCFSTGTITSSNVFGGYVDVTVNLNNNGTLEIMGSHPAGVPGPYIPKESYRVTGGTCASDTGSGLLTRTTS